MWAIRSFCNSAVDWGTSILLLWYQHHSFCMHNMQADDAIIVHIHGSDLVLETTHTSLYMGRSSLTSYGI